MKIDNAQNNNIKFGQVGMAKLSKGLLPIANRDSLSLETAFYRDLPSLLMARDYIETVLRFKRNVRVLDGACSTGEETWSIAMVLCDMLDRVKITGFDLFNKEAITKAKKGIYPVSQATSATPQGSIDALMLLNSCFDGFKDSFLAFGDVKKFNPAQRHCRDVFEHFFSEVKDKNKIKTLSKSFDNDFFSGIKKCLNFETKFFQVKPENRKVCDFVQGDILKLKDIAEPESADVLLFRNALYQLTTDDTPMGMVNAVPKTKEQIIEILDSIVANARETLVPHGVFITGKNHLFGHYPVLDECLEKAMSKHGFNACAPAEMNMGIWQKRS